MPTLNIVEYDNQYYQNISNYVKIQNITFDDAAPIQSDYFSNNVSLIRLVSTENCWILFGTNPTVTAENGIFLQANNSAKFNIEPGHRLSVLQAEASENSGGGLIEPAVPTGPGEADGLMTHEDKAKLDGIEDSADVNQFLFHGFEGRAGSILSGVGTVLSLAVPSAQSVWLNGIEYPLTAGLSIDLGETPDLGAHYIVAQDDGAGALELAELPAVWSITETSYTPATVGYWNGSAFAVQEERHGHTRNLDLHAYLHSTVGARIENDGSFTQVRPNTVIDDQLELVAGSLWDEDIENDISTAKAKLVRNWYETASGIWTWVNGVNNAGYDRPYIWNSGTSRLRYPDSGNAYTLTDCAANRFITVWVYASNDVDRPIYVVTPALAATYTTVANARAATAPVLPFAPELKLLYRWIYRGDGEYQESADYRTASSLPSGGVAAPMAASVVVIPSDTLVEPNAQAALESLAQRTASLNIYRAISFGAF